MLSSEHVAKIAEDSILAGTTSFTTGALINPTPSELHTVYIPLITGILAPLVKELILTLREMRRRRKCEIEREPENEAK